MDKTIGLVLATYNGEKYIAEQLDSIINQSIVPDVIVITDGGSKDNTLVICEEELTKSGISFHIYRSDKQLSVKDNFEKGLTLCDCDYIFFSDQDDVWKREKIEITLSYIQSYNAEMAFVNADLVDDALHFSGKSLWDYVGYRQKESVRVLSQSFLRELIRHNIVTGMCMCISSDLRNKVLPFSDYTIHDYWIALNSLCLGKVIAINEKLVLYRQHSNNAIGTSSSIAKKIAHSKQYLSRIKNRIMLFEEFENVRKNDLEEELKLEIQNYLCFLQDRIKFLSGEKSLLYPFFERKLYIKYVYDYKGIMVKDFLSRLYLKGE